MISRNLIFFLRMFFRSNMRRRHTICGRWSDKIELTQKHKRRTVLDDSIASRISHYIIAADFQPFFPGRAKSRFIDDSRTQTLFAGRLFSIKLTQKWLMNKKLVFFCCAVYFVFGHGLDSADIVWRSKRKKITTVSCVTRARTNIRRDREEREMNELCCESFVIRTKWKLNFHHFNISYSRPLFSALQQFFSSLAQSHTSSRWGNLIVDVRERNDE